MQFKSLHVKNKSVSLSTLELGTVTGEATGLTVTLCEAEDIASSSP